MSKICKKCGAELNDTAKFCLNCGTPAEEEESQLDETFRFIAHEELQQPVDPDASTAPAGPFMPQPPVNPAVQPVAAEPQKKKSPVVPIVIAIVLTIAVVVGGFFIYLGVSGKSISDVFGGSDEKTTEEDNTTEKTGEEDKTNGGKETTEAPSNGDVNNGGNSGNDSNKIDSSKITVPAIKKLVDSGEIKPVIDVDSYLTYSELMKVYNNKDANALTELSEKQAAMKKYQGLQKFFDYLIESFYDSEGYELTSDGLIEVYDLYEGNGFIIIEIGENIFAFTEKEDSIYLLIHGEDKISYMDVDDFITMMSGNKEKLSACYFVYDEEREKLKCILYGYVTEEETVTVGYNSSGELDAFCYEDKDEKKSYYNSDFET